jgi:type IV pilus assembly protein PilW
LFKKGSLAQRHRGDKGDMRFRSAMNEKGITLIELLVALVISAILIAGIYRVFVAQTRAYTVQDQVVEVQQNVRGAMEILLRDLRMAGCDDDNLNSTVTIPTPITPVADNAITVNYERSFFDTVTNAMVYQNHLVNYSLNGSDLIRTLTLNGVQTQETLLGNVDTLSFAYGVDQNDDGAVDAWRAAAAVGTTKVIAVQVTLRAGPTSVTSDVQQMVSPRVLTSTVTLRNLCLVR